MKPAVFISYRRNDAFAVVHALRDKLVADDPERRVFVDVDNIPPGRSFREPERGR